MTEGHPNRQKQEPASRKTALATFVEETVSHFRQPGSVADVEPPLFHKVSPGPVDPLSKLIWYWHKDLAAKFFLITIAVLLVFSTIFAITANHMVSRLVPAPTQHINI